MSRRSRPGPISDQPDVRFTLPEWPEGISEEALARMEETLQRRLDVQLVAEEDGTVTMRTAEGAVYLSTDNGQTWELQLSADEVAETLSPAEGFLDGAPAGDELMRRLNRGEPVPGRQVELNITTNTADIEEALRSFARLPRRRVDHAVDSLRYAMETMMAKKPVHALGATVCCPGHRHQLTVVAYAPHVGGPPRNLPAFYTLQDERDPRVQPFPVVRAPARNVKAYGWRGLLELSDTLFSGGPPVIISPPSDAPGTPDELRRLVEQIRIDERMGVVMPVSEDSGFTMQLQNSGHDLEVRAHYLDACAHLHDLAHALPEGSSAQKAAHDTADELLNGAAQRWWKKCKPCGGRGLVADDHIGLMSDGSFELRRVTCKPCDGTGRVSRIGDDHRMRLTLGLIAAGLPERKRGEDYSEMKAMVEAATPRRQSRYPMVIGDPNDPGSPFYAGGTD